MVGQNIGKYRVLDRVGRGGMGTVYRAIDETLHREVAIKVLNAELNDPEVAKRFRAEAITVARLSHPGIATIYELFQHDGQWLMVMEFVRGETLERLIERTGPQTPERSAELCMHSLAALAHAHAMGVVHRDLKPANIMLTENGVIKLMDFGIARVAGTEHLTNAGFMMGTPAYMAPEQVLGHEIDARADLYAIGVVFYRLLTAQLPFKGDTPFAMAQAQVNNPPTPVGTVRAGLPAWVDDVMAKSLAKKPEDRFQSAVEFHEGFARSLSVSAASGSYTSPVPANLMGSQPVPTGTAAQTMLSTPRSGTAIPVAGPSPSGAHSSEISGVGPTIAAGTPVATARPAQSVSGGYPAGDQTVLSPSGAQQILSPSGAQAVIAQSGAQPGDLFGSGAQPVSGSSGAVLKPLPGGGPSAVSDAGPGAMRTGQPQSPEPLTGLGATGEPAAKRSSAGLVAAAAVLVLVGGAAAFYMMRQPAPPPAEPPAAEVAAADAGAAVPPPAAPPVVPEPAPTDAASSAVPATPSGSARGAAANPAGTTSPDGSTPLPPAASGAAAGRGGSAPTTPVDDSLLAVTNVRVLVVTGKKANDQEILLNFSNGQIALVNARSGTPVATLPYRSIAGATYVRARDPRWNPALASPPDDLDVGGMLRTSKHYLTLQGKDSYQILRLEDNNVIRVLQAVEARTGITVDRQKPGDRN
jgi:serine/threonine-protein kinase